MIHAQKLLSLAFVAGLSAYACSGSTGSIGNDAGLPSPEAGAERTTSEAALRRDTRDAFVSELQASHLYAMTALVAAPESNVQYARVLRADDAIAAEIARFYGPRARDELALLLYARAIAFSDLVAWLGSQKVSEVRATGDLYTNAAQIAELFARLDASAWPDLEAKLDREIDASVSAVIARRDGDLGRTVKELDAAEQAALAVGDAIVAGLRAAFPSDISASPLAPALDDLHADLRVVMDDHAFWVRAWSIDWLARRQAQPELDRAVQSTNDFGAAFASTYGTAVGSRLQYHFHNDTTDAVAYVLASETGDRAVADSIARQWSVDGDGLAHELALTTAAVPADRVQRDVADAIGHERAMIDARFAADWESESSHYESWVATLAEVADVVAGAAARSPSLPR